jgi:hypothetical protein
MSLAVGGSTSRRLGKFRALRLTFSGGAGGGQNTLVQQQLDGEPFSHNMAGASGPCVAEVRLDGKSKIVLFPDQGRLISSDKSASGGAEDDAPRRERDFAGHCP